MKRSGDGLLQSQINKGFCVKSCTGRKIVLIPATPGSFSHVDSELALKVQANSDVIRLDRSNQEYDLPIIRSLAPRDPIRLGRRTIDGKASLRNMLELVDAQVNFLAKTSLIPRTDGTRYTAYSFDTNYNKWVIITSQLPTVPLPASVGRKRTTRAYPARGRGPLPFWASGFPMGTRGRNLF